MIRAALAALVFLAAGAGPLYAQTPAFGADLIELGKQINGGQSAEGLAAVKALADQGRSDAAEFYAELIVTGHAGSPDHKMACDYFERAARERADGLHNFAHCHEDGLSRPRDALKAAALYERAIAEGYVQSRCALGNLLIGGDGITADVARGLSLCEEAAKAGDINAMTDLGNRYLMGSAVPRDIGRARVLYEAAAAKGQANAASTLGQIYWNGDGVPRDNAAAAKWWRIAYDGGRTDAAEHLGNEAFVRAMDREKGMVNVVTLSEAGQWYRKALAAPLSAEERGRVENYLSMITQELNRLGK